VRKFLFAAILTVAVAGCGVAAADDAALEYCFEDGSCTTDADAFWSEADSLDAQYYDEALPAHEGA